MEFVRIRGGDQGLRLLGVDPIAEPPFRSYLRGENESADFEALNQIIAVPGTVVISDTLALRLNLDVGDQLEISAAGRFSNAQIVGILQTGNNSSRQALDDLIISDIATAQEWTGMAGRLSRIDLILDEGDVERIRSVLPAGATLLESGEGDALSQMIAAFEINLQAMSLLAPGGRLVPDLQHGHL